MSESVLQRQVIPVALTAVVFAFLAGLLYVEILILNQFTETDIVLSVNWLDILIGLTIYLKTSIDFAIYIANLMDNNPGWKSRVAIEIGTAAGNAAGTMVILLIWTFFKEVRWLLVLMILIAALVLFVLAEEGLEHAQQEDNRFPKWFQKTVLTFQKVLHAINAWTSPVLKVILPHASMKTGSHLKFLPLFAVSFSVPFILGLDDFAGYVPLFSIVNVLGFGIGVFGGHMLLNMLLYISPERTIRAVKNPVISFLGSVAFVLIGLWGIYEAIKMLFLEH